MTLGVRDFLWHEDYGTVMKFLAEVIELTQSVRNLIPTRFENRKYGPCGPEYLDEEDSFVKIWEDTDTTDSSGRPRIVAVGVFTDSPDSFFSLHPDYKHLDREIIIDMERMKAAMPPTDDRGLRIAFFVEATDTERINLMKDLGLLLLWS
ncbi:MAG: hypothetical protein P1Q69_10135 [Candidatus Thorarchaeota archaeon]|nr:hypothetical protein [Candidatus Thorarchaeota archaeon]